MSGKRCAGPWKRCPTFVIVGETFSGEEALALTVMLQPDIVLLETDLAGIDGYAVAQALKSCPQSPQILFLTLHSDLVLQRRSSDAGGDAFLPKAAGWTALIATMHFLLEADNRPNLSLPPEEAAAPRLETDVSHRMQIPRQLRPASP